MPEYRLSPAAERDLTNIKAGEKPANIALGQILSPSLACRGVDVIYPAAGCMLHAITGHEA